MKLVKEIDLIQVKKDNFNDVVKFIRKYHSEKECKIELLNTDSDIMFMVEVTYNEVTRYDGYYYEQYYPMGSYIASDSSCTGNIRLYKFTEQSVHDKLEFDGFEIVEN